MTAEERILQSIGNFGAAKAAKGAVRLRLGTVRQLAPLQVETAGLLLGPEGLYIDDRLLPETTREAKLGNVHGLLEAQVNCTVGAITQLQAFSGNLSGSLQWMEAAFAVGDTVIMLTDDDQRFFILAKVVSAS